MPSNSLQRHCGAGFRVMKKLVINLSFFKAGWLAAVFTAAYSMPLAGTAIIGVAVLVHLALSKNANAEFRLLAIAALIGLAWESLLVASGLVEYNVASIVPGIAPYWIVAMWVLFATTINVGMRWLKKNVYVAAIAGGIGGPMSFLAGSKAGAVTFPDPTLSLIVIGVGWAVLLPILVQVAMRDDCAIETAGKRERSGDNSHRGMPIEVQA